MKIAYLSTFYPFKGGGITTFNSLLTNELTRQNHIVVPLTFTTQYPKFMYGKASQMAEKRYNYDVEGERILSTINPFSWIKTIKKIKKLNPDILLMRYWHTGFAPAFGTIIRFIPRKIKIIVILDNIIPHEKQFYDNAANKYFLQKKIDYVVMSESVKCDLFSFQKNANVTLISHPIYGYGNIINKQQAQQTLNLKPNRKTLLFFGLIRDYKGLDILIKTFSQLDDSYQLIIAGECRSKADLYEDLIKNSANKNIIFHNKFVSDDDVNLYFSAADVCILPYRSATQSGITGICYHFELPMIATNVGGLAEMIVHQKTGIIAPEISENCLLDSIKEYFEHSDIEMFKENIKELKFNYSWENFATTMINAVQSEK